MTWYVQHGSCGEPVDLEVVLKIVCTKQLICCMLQSLPCSRPICWCIKSSERHLGIRALETIQAEHTKCRIQQCLQSGSTGSMIRYTLYMAPMHIAASSGGCLEVAWCCGSHHVNSMHTQVFLNINTRQHSTWNSMQYHTDYTCSYIQARCLSIMNANKHCWDIKWTWSCTRNMDINWTLIGRVGH